MYWLDILLITALSQYWRQAFRAAGLRLDADRGQGVGQRHLCLRGLDLFEPPDRRLRLREVLRLSELIDQQCEAYQDADVRAEG